MKKLICFILCLAMLLANTAYAIDSDGPTPGTVLQRGDVNGDGNVNTTDAVILLRYIAMWDIKSFDPVAADYNGDGKLNTKDVIGMLRYIAGWITESPIWEDLVRTAELINEERARAGLFSLTLDPTLSGNAVTRAKELEASFTSTRPDGSKYTTAITNISKYKSTGQTYSKGATSPEKAVQTFVANSKFPLSPDLNELGVGIYENDGVFYWVLLFGEAKKIPSSEQYLAIAKETVRLIAEYRFENGFASFSFDDQLTKDANIRAKELSENFSSTRPDGSKFSTVITKPNYYTSFVELIASNFDTPESVVAQWKNSSYLLNGTYNTAGVGIYVSDNTIYWSLILGARKDIPTHEKYREYGLRVTELVNIARAEEGITQTLTFDDILFADATVRAEESSVLFEHTRPDGTSYSTAITEGEKYRGSGENLAYGQQTPEEVVTAWLNSPGHRANIMNPQFTHIGVGIYEKDGVLYWTQLFGSKRDIPSPDRYGEYARDIFDRINAERKNVGSVKLSLDTQLCADAAVRAKEITSLYSSTRPNGESFATAITNPPAVCTFVEINAMDYDKPEQIANMLFGSDGLSSQLTSTEYTKAGIALAEGNGMLYWEIILLG